uniref:Uncharacterized protein n=1 Tax=Oryza brachyantha TaxID=4533 RepID=J3N959_ORYBR
MSSSYHLLAAVCPASPLLIEHCILNSPSPVAALPAATVQLKWRTLPASFCGEPRAAAGGTTAGEVAIEPLDQARFGWVYVAMIAATRAAGGLHRGARRAAPPRRSPRPLQ